MEYQIWATRTKGDNEKKVMVAEQSKPFTYWGLIKLMERIKSKASLEFDETTKFEHINSNNEVAWIN